MREITGIGREPGRSRADRSVLTARRGRFSPFNLIDRSAFHAGRSVFRGRPLVLRHLYRPRTVVAVCLAGLVLFGLPASTSGEPAKAARKAKVSKPSKSPASAKTVKKSTRVTSTTTTSRKPDYKSKFRPIKPPPADGGRPPKKKEPVRPGIRPPKDKKPRPDPPPSDWERYPDPPPYVEPIWPYVEPNWGYEIEYVQVYVSPEEDADPPKDIEFTSLLLTSVTIVWNAVYINAGQPNEFVATAGFFTGVSSLALAFSGKSEHAGLNVLFGTASIVFSVLNLVGGLEPPVQKEYDYYTGDSSYSFVPASPHQVGYTYSF